MVTMHCLMQSLFVLKFRLTCFCWLVLVVCASDAAQAQGAPRPASAPSAATASPPAAQGQALPSPESMFAMIRSSLLALGHANETGNYTVLRDLSAPGFQASNSAAKLGIIFADLRDRGIDLLPAAILTPTITAGPSLTPQGMLSLAGYIPTQPHQMNFELAYQVVNGRWRLFGISVNPAAASPAVAGAASKVPEAAATKASPPIAKTKP
jgi:hypothetical protein